LYFFLATHEYNGPHKKVDYCLEILKRSHGVPKFF
jgi:hypothetical protein